MQTVACQIPRNTCLNSDPSLTTENRKRTLVGNDICLDFKHSFPTNVFQRKTKNLTKSMRSKEEGKHPLTVFNRWSETLCWREQRQALKAAATISTELHLSAFHPSLPSVTMRVFAEMQLQHFSYHGRELPCLQPGLQYKSAVTRYHSNGPLLGNY